VAGAGHVVILEQPDVVDRAVADLVGRVAAGRPEAEGRARTGRAEAAGS
jgi:hypothetical protein